MIVGIHIATRGAYPYRLDGTAFDPLLFATRGLVHIDYEGYMWEGADTSTASFQTEDHRGTTASWQSIDSYVPTWND